MNKRELITQVSAKASVSKKQAETIVSAAMEAIMGKVSAGEKVTLAGFGSFEPRHHKQRMGRHPKTGHTLMIPAKTVPAFSAGKRFKNIVAQELHILRIRPASPHRIQPNDSSQPTPPSFKKRVKNLTTGMLKFWK